MHGSRKKLSRKESKPLIKSKHSPSRDYLVFNPEVEVYDGEKFYPYDLSSSEAEEEPPISTSKPSTSTMKSTTLISLQERPQPEKNIDNVDFGDGQDVADVCKKPYICNGCFGGEKTQVCCSLTSACEDCPC